MRKDSCPVCGQSGLLDAKLENFNNLRVVICQECEAMWEGTSFQDVSNFVRYEDFMESKGIEPNWKKVKIVDA